MPALGNLDLHRAMSSINLRLHFFNKFGLQETYLELFSMEVMGSVVGCGMRSLSDTPDVAYVEGPAPK